MNNNLIGRQGPHQSLDQRTLVAKPQAAHTQDAQDSSWKELLKTAKLERENGNPLSSPPSPGALYYHSISFALLPPLFIWSTSSFFKAL